ncbi:hypothetical protein ES705_32001 [subsurface metagenome]|nr:hypothetical protein [Methanosarcinales archaeon]
MAVKQNGIEIVKRFAELGFQVQPEAIELLSQSEAERDFDLNEIVENVTDSLDPSIFVISTEQIAEFIKNKVAGTGKGEKEGGIRFQKQTHVPAPAIIKSFSDNGRGVDHKDFLPHFLDRYERISEIIKRRMNCRQIRYIRNGMRGEEVSVVGMVASVNKTAKGNIRVELELATHQRK